MAEATPAAPTPTPVPEPVSKPSSSPVNLIVITVLALVALTAIGLAIYAQSQAQKATKAANDMNARVSKIENADRYVGSQVNPQENQAVFLSSGQVYFGKITHITPTTLTLEKIYYLTGDGSFDKNTQSSTGNVQLIKLGNELHKPEDKMIIERKNVDFWENIKNDSDVSKAITQYEKQHPSN